MYYIYMLRCKNNSIYTGITSDIERRMKEHFTKDKNCAKYTLSHEPQKIESVWKTESRVNACKLEYHIKRLRKEQKEELVLKNNVDKLLGKSVDASKYFKYECKAIKLT